MSLFKLLPLHDWGRVALPALVSAAFAGLVVLLPVPVLLRMVTGNLFGRPGPTLVSFQAGAYCVRASIIFAVVYMGLGLATTTFTKLERESPRQGGSNGADEAGRRFFRRSAG